MSTGKNHHRVGCFGSHTRAFTLLRHDGHFRRCSAFEEPELYAATIGGLGLTGLILDATMQLRRVPGLMLVAEDIRFDGLDEFYGSRRRQRIRVGESWLGKFGQVDRWSFCLTAARMARGQERR